MTMNNMLAKIAAKKRQEINKNKLELSLESIKSMDYPILRDFTEALRKKSPAIIAEIKKGSPSKGIIREDFDVAKIATDYDKHGAACLSVLTDESFFYGHNDNIKIAKENSMCPILRKDFILDPYQVYESRILGADCILLIVAMLEDKELHHLCELALSLSMSVLVESHNKEELKRALSLPTPLIGINNRNLDNFTTDINTSIRLKNMISEDKIIISESGIHTREDIHFLTSQGIRCFLIGESLMREKSPGTHLQYLIS